MALRHTGSGCALVVRGAELSARELTSGWASELDYIGTAALSLRVYRLRSGSGAGPHHLHSESESVYFVLSGEIEVRLGADHHRLAQADLVFIPPMMDHSVANAGEKDAVILEIYAPGRADFIRVE